MLSQSILNKPNINPAVIAPKIAKINENRAKSN
jgi:hypothetical protein